MATCSSQGCRLSRPHSLQRLMLGQRGKACRGAVQGVQQLSSAAVRGAVRVSLRCAEQQT